MLIDYIVDPVERATVGCIAVEKLLVVMIWVKYDTCFGDRGR